MMSMKKLTLGIAAAGVLLTAVPAMAQVGFYAGRHGVSVGLGVPGPYYNGCGYNYPCGGYYDYYGGPGVFVGGGHGWHGGGGGRGGYGGHHR
jgi:hypothetical protein